MRRWSGTYSPRRIAPRSSSNTSLIAPKELDTEALAHPPKGGFTAGFRAYAASKLCNILTARALAAANPRMTVVAYNPGYTPGTGLQREWPVWARAAAAAGSVLRPVARLATVDQAGDALADLALGEITPPDGRIYASMVKRQVTWPDPVGAGPPGRRHAHPLAGQRQHDRPLTQFCSSSRTRLRNSSSYWELNNGTDDWGGRDVLSIGMSLLL
jgi:hypothetical protein